MESTLVLPSNSEVVSEPAKLRFVRVKFSDRANSKEYTYRVEHDAEVVLGQTAITRRNLSKVTITAVDCEAVPGLDLARYDFVDPVPVYEEEPVITGFGETSREPE